MLALRIALGRIALGRIALGRTRWGDGYHRFPHNPHPPIMTGGAGENKTLPLGKPMACNVSAVPLPTVRRRRCAEPNSAECIRRCSWEQGTRNLGRRRPWPAG